MQNPETASVPRVIPKSMLRETAAPSKVEARTEIGFANDEEGVCPVCKTAMKLSTSNGVDVHVCFQHRVVMPLKNQE